MKILFYGIITSLLLSSCIDENFDEVYNNFAVRTSLSVPVGYGDYVLETTDFTGSGSDIPGIYGSNYYNGIQFPQNNPYYVRNDTNEFAINIEKIIEKGVKSCSFRVNIDNFYPTDVEVQIYFEDRLGKLDSVFLEGPKTILGAETDTSGNVINSTYQIFDVSFDNRMDILANAETYIIHGKIYTYKQGLKKVKFTDNSRVKIVLGARFLIDVKTNEI